MLEDMKSNDLTNALEVVSSKSLADVELADTQSLTSAKTNCVVRKVNTTNGESPLPATHEEATGAAPEFEDAINCSEVAQHFVKLPSGFRVEVQGSVG